jgi:hypothetical protein
MRAHRAWCPTRIEFPDATPRRHCCIEPIVKITRRNISCEIHTEWCVASTDRANHCPHPRRRAREADGRQGLSGGFAALETLDRSMQQCPPPSSHLDHRTQNERHVIQQLVTTPQPKLQQHMTRDRVRTLVQQIGELTVALSEAEPADRAEVYRQLGPNSPTPRTTKSPRTGTA